MELKEYNMKTLFIVRGVPGSGKTTLAGMLPVNCHFEADQFFTNEETGEYIFDATKLKEAHEWCRASVEKAMKGYNANAIAVSNTFTQEWEMKAYFDLAEQYDYRVISLIVEKRHGGNNVHGVPSEKIQQMIDRFDIKL